MNKEKAGIPKWLQQKLKAEGKSTLQPRVYQMSKTNPADLRKASQVSQKTEKRPILKEKPKIQKNFDLRHIFVIVDGQDILAEELQFSYIEINERLSKFVSDKVW